MRGHRYADHTSLIQSQPCPHCKRVLDAAGPATSKEDIRPKPGDMTICLYCAVILRFLEGGALEIVPLDDLRELAETHPDVVAEFGRVWYAAKQRLRTPPNMIH